MRTFLLSIMRPVLALMIFMNALPAVPARAAFDDIGVGARVPAMADAFTAAADDANALYYNPAGLIQVGERQLVAQYGEMNRGLTDGSRLTAQYFGYAHPLSGGEKGTFAAAYHSFQADTLFTDRTLFLSYGSRLRLPAMNLRGIPSVGVTLKQLHRSYNPSSYTENALNDGAASTGESDPLFADAGYTTDNFALDIGGLYQYGERLEKSIGISFINLNRPDTSLAQEGDKIPVITKIGYAYRPTWGLLSAELRRANRLSGKTDNDVAFGAERNFRFDELGILAVRSGYASGSRGYKALTAGFGWTYSKVQIDYAFSLPIGNLEDISGSHRIGFAVHFGMPSAKSLNLDAAADGDLVASFERNSDASLLATRRFATQRKLSDDARALLLRLLMRRVPDTEPALAQIRRELRVLLLSSEDMLMDWPVLRRSIVRDVPTAERIAAEETVELLASGDRKSSMARIYLLSAATRQASLIDAVLMIDLAELAAEAYRTGDLDTSLDMARRMVETLPGDAVIEKGYRDLLALRDARRRAPADQIAPKPAATPQPDMVPTPVEVPDAPQTLTAPVPVRPETAAPTDAELAIRSFGTALGHYYSRKAQGASLAERRALLEEIRSTYSKKIDMTLVERELAEIAAQLPAAPAATPPAAKPEAAQPVVKPTPAAPKAPAAKPAAAPPAKPAVTPAARPAAVRPVAEPTTLPSGKRSYKFDRSAGVEKAWDFYREVGARGLTDGEKLEILTGMKTAFPADERIDREIGRLKRRMEP